MAKPHVVVLGAGPAGLGAAYRLTRQGIARVTVLEQQDRVGGNAGSFELAGMRVDYGSHRLHPSCDPEILSDIRSLLRDDLLDRPRHGRIRLCGRWVHFPLKPLDLALHLPPWFSANVAADLLHKTVANGNGRHGKETFASLLEQGLGQTICQNFYFPYVEKIWGIKPEELSVTLARRRVSASSLSKMVRRIVAAIPGLNQNGKGRFFYPRGGYGQISEAYRDAAQQGGADIRLKSRVQSVELESSEVRVIYQDQEGKKCRLAADYVWSTIPITILVKCLTPAAPPDILQAVENISYRGMILIYLVLEQTQFGEFDAYYFPEATIPISRLSEPKNYSNASEPTEYTVLCAELPCLPDGPEWTKMDEELGQTTCMALESSGIPIRAPIKQIVTRRLKQAYPIYRAGYERAFDAIDQWVAGQERLLTFGRQGLFAHDNTHHALYMAYCAVKCLSNDGRFDDQRWRSFREVFETHVVED
jgi:protoporphyrinogen oxidase